MLITPIKTEKILPKQLPLLKLLDTSIKQFRERSILVITSKIVALCEGRIVSLDEDKDKLIEQEATYYLPKKFRRFGASGTITHSAFIGAAGIDESNTSGHYLLLPKDSQKTASEVYRYLKKRFSVREAGVIIVDSHSTPLRRGASGIALAYRGFVGLKDYRGQQDLFGRTFLMEQANIADPLASVSALAMGEGAEQTPLVVIEDIAGMTFHKNAPTKKELSAFFVDLKDDIFAPLFNLKRLKKGRGKR